MFIHYRVICVHVSSIHYTPTLLSIHYTPSILYATPPNRQTFKPPNLQTARLPNLVHSSELYRVHISFLLVHSMLCKFVDIKVYSIQIKQCILSCKKKWPLVSVPKAFSHKATTCVETFFCRILYM